MTIQKVLIPNQQWDLQKAACKDSSSFASCFPWKTLNKPLVMYQWVSPSLHHMIPFSVTDSISVLKFRYPGDSQPVSLAPFDRRTSGTRAYKHIHTKRLDTSLCKTENGQFPAPDYSRSQEEDLCCSDLRQNPGFLCSLEHYSKTILHEGHNQF